MNKEDKIKCVNVLPLEGNDKAPELTLDSEYDIKEVYECDCGEKHLNVGLELNLNYVECYKCRETLPPTTHWCNSIRFTKI